VAARAGEDPLIGGRGGEPQERCQRGGAGLMHGRAHGHLDRFQIEPAGLAATGEKDA
jgi:hypothetical protein